MAEIKAGYKQTDIGLIPEDWGVKSISSLCEIVSGGTPSTANPAFWFKGDIPWCTPSDITSTSGKYLHKTDRNITSLGLSKSTANLLPEGSLLLCSRATIGEVKIAKTKIATNQGFKSLICRSVDNEFMYYKVLTLKDKLLQFSIGSTFLEFSKKDIARLHIIVPKLEEQKAIAAALSDVDGLIESLEQLIAKKRDMKTAAMQQLLTGQKRLPGFEVLSGYKQTDIVVIPEDWGVITFNKLADPNDPYSITGGPFGSNLQSRDYTPKGIRIIQLQNIGDGIFYDDYEIFTSIDKANELRSCNVYPGDIILSKMGDPVARATLVPKANARYLMCSDGIRLNVDRRRNSELYTFYYINSLQFRKAAEAASTGSTRKRIGLSELKKLPVIIPKLEEQTAIATILSDMDTEIDGLEQRLEKARSLKTGMMQELLTGKTRLIKTDKKQEMV